MCWSGRDELREQEEEEAEQRAWEAYQRKLAEWQEESKRTAEAMLPGLVAWYEREEVDHAKPGCCEEHILWGKPWLAKPVGVINAKESTWAS